MLRLLYVLVLCCVLTTTPVSAKNTSTAKATSYHGMPNFRTTIRSVYPGTTRVKLKYTESVDGWVRFKAPSDGRYVFVFSDIKTNLKKTDMKPAIFCFYTKYFDKLNIDGLGTESNGFALGYDRPSSVRTSYKDKMGVSVVMDSGDTVNICCSNILSNDKKSTASYTLQISKESE